MRPKFMDILITSFIRDLLRLKILSSCNLVFHSSVGASELLICSTCKALIQSELLEACG